MFEHLLERTRRPVSLWMVGYANTGHHLVSGNIRKKHQQILVLPCGCCPEILADVTKEDGNQQFGTLIFGRWTTEAASSLA